MSDFLNFYHVLKASSRGAVISPINTRKQNGEQQFHSQFLVMKMKNWWRAEFILYLHIQYIHNI